MRVLLVTAKWAQEVGMETVGVQRVILFQSDWKTRDKTGLEQTRCGRRSVVSGGDTRESGPSSWALLIEKRIAETRGGTGTRKGETTVRGIEASSRGCRTWKVRMRTRHITSKQVSRNVSTERTKVGTRNGMAQVMAREGAGEGASSCDPVRRKATQANKHVRTTRTPES